MSALSHIDFQNLILERDIGKARFRRGKANGNTLVPPKEDQIEDLKRLYDQTYETWLRNKSDPDFSIEYDKIRFRCSVIMDNVFVYRRMLDTVPNLSACGLHPKIVKYMLDIKSGMVLFVGEFSSGKTTAASAYLVEHVKKNGGLAIALEDPSELPTNGDHGPGRIYQISLNRTEIEQKAHDLVRSNYDVLYYSELRGALMTWSAILSAAGGRVIISTVHGPTIPQALSRTINLTNSLNTGGDMGAASVLGLFADSLKVVVFMNEFETGGYGPTGYLLVNDDVRASLRKGDFAGLNNSIDRTLSSLRANKSLTDILR